MCVAAAGAFIRAAAVRFFLQPPLRPYNHPLTIPRLIHTHQPSLARYILRFAAALALDTTRMCAWRLSPVRKLPRKNSFSHFLPLHTIRLYTYTHTHTRARALAHTLRPLERVFVYVCTFYFFFIRNSFSPLEIQSALWFLRPFRAFFNFEFPTAAVSRSPPPAC